MSIPARFLEELRTRLTLSTVVGARVRLTRAGREHKACCPFHHEKSPSFYVNDAKGFYHCFGCGAHGDVIDFVKAHDNLSFVEAVQTLAAQAGLAVPQSSPQDVQKAREEKDLYTLLDAARVFFEEHLDTAARTYLHNRGLNDDTIAAFRLGLAPTDGTLLRKYLQSKGFEDPQMIEAGLLRPSTDARPPYAFFRSRIMFPVSDPRGRVVAFGGRIYGADAHPNAPKYINSPDTPIFHKGRTLYGAAQARNAAHKGHTVIVVEGYMDVIACHQAGFGAAVAPMGTALTPDQIAGLWALMPQDDKAPVLCLDGDTAGQKAAARAAHTVLPLLTAGHSLRIAFLPQGQDPDSLLRENGPPALRRVLEGAISLFDFLWMSASAGKPLNTPEGRAGVKTHIERVLHTIADRGVQVHYRTLMHERMGSAFFAKKGKRPKPKARVHPRRAPIL